MPKLVIVRYLGSLPGESHYEVHTPMGTWGVDMVQYTAGSFEAAGYGTRPRWMVTSPGENTPDSQFDRKRDAVAYVALLVDESLEKNGGDAVRMAVEAHRMELHQDNSPWAKVAEQQTTPVAEEPTTIKEADTVTETAPRYITHSFTAGTCSRFAVKDTETGIDVATFSSRYAARDKRDRLNADLTAPETREAQLAQEAGAAEVTESARRFVVNQLGNGYFAVRDLVTELDVATVSSRYAANDKADRLEAEATQPATERAQTDPLATVDFGEPKCVHGFYERPADRGAAIKACDRKPPAVSVGVFSDEGCVEFFDCAVQASDETARSNAEEGAPADAPMFRWAVLCADHEEQPKDGCEECAAEGCGAVDADDLDACGECSDCTG